MIEITWKSGSSSGCSDLIPSSWLQYEGFVPELWQRTRGYRIPGGIARCSLEVSANQAILDYSGIHKSFNAKLGWEIGSLAISFHDETRGSVREVLWKAEEGEYVNEDPTIKYVDDPIRVVSKGDRYRLDRASYSNIEIPYFEREFRRFSEEVYPRHGYGHFLSFRDGAALGWEGYKPRLRDRALKILDPLSWVPSEIGSGAILERAVAAIEIGGNDQSRNNLVSWEGRYGPASAGHTALLTALGDKVRRVKFEQWFWDAFHQNEPLGVLFERLRALAGDGYPLAAYLFFLIDVDHFAPIAPRTFDEAFRRLGVPLVTSGRCSWTNYKEFNDAIEAVRVLLIAKPGLSDARHIDAHSFLWMMVRMEEEGLVTGKTPGAVRYADARTRSIYEMAANALSAASQSGKQFVHTYKDKQANYKQQELERLINMLVELQGGLCAVTGLTLQWKGHEEDEAMLASLDRVDSDGHYVDGNIQVVCRFINKWKSNSPDGEFRRLVDIVRGKYPIHNLSPHDES